MSLDLTTIAASPAEKLDDVALLALALDRSPSSAAALMVRFGGISGVARASIAELGFARVPRRRVHQLHAALELGRRTLAEPLARGMVLADARQAEQFMWSRLAAREQEEI